MQHSTTTPTPTESDPHLAERLPFMPVVRPFYQTLNEFERQVLDSRQADMTRDQRMDYDPYT